MKLHLPKSLLLSILSALTLASPLAVTLGSSAWAGWASDANCDGYIYYYDNASEASSRIETLTLPTEENKGDFDGNFSDSKQEDAYANLFLCSGYGGDKQPSGYSGQISTIGKIVAQDGTSLTIAVNPWQGWKSYTSLTIEELEFGGGTGSGSFNVNHADDNVIVNAVSGTLSSVNNAGNLTLGSVTMGGDITNAGTLSLRGELGGSGTITNSGDSAKLNVDLSGGYGGFNGVVYTYAGGVTANGKSGFVRGNQIFRVLAETVTYEGAVYVNGSETSTALNGGNVSFDAGESAAFYVDDTWNYSSEQSNGASSFEVSGAGTLNFAGGSTVEGGMTINSRGAVTMSADTTFSDTVTINGGTFNNDSKKVDGGKLVFNNLSSAEIKGNRKLSASLELNNTYLSIGTEDTFDYDDTSALTFKIGSGATLDVQSYRQSLRSNHIIEMAGGTLKGAGGANGGYTYGIDFYNGGRFNTSANSRIETNVGGHINPSTGSRYNIQFDVNTGVTLTMTGNLVGETTFSKTAGGTMVYSGAAFNQALTISGGVFEYNFTGERTHTGSITGAGTLRKSGEGTLNLSSANTSVGKLAVTGGKLVYTVADEKTHTLSGTGGTFEKTGAGTLNLGALTSYDFAGGLTVSEGKVVFDGVDTEDTSASKAPAFVTLVKNLTTAKDAEVKIDGNVKFNYQQSTAADSIINIDDNITITGNLEINSYESGNAPDGDGMRRWNVNEGGNLSVDGHLWLTNKQKMVVDGGVVSAAGGVQLGHSSNGTGNWTNHSIYSKLIIEDGGVTTSGLTFHGGNNELLMSGGELTFTPTATEDNPAPNVLSGGGTETYKNKFTVTGGTLKATDTSWALTGTSTHVVSLGNATFDIAADKTITLSGTMALTGSLDVVGDGTLQVGGTTWNVQSSDLANFMVTGGVVNDSTKVNGLGTYSDYIFIRGNVEQQPDTATSILVDNAATTIHKQDGYWTFTGTAAGAYVIGGNFSTEEAATDTDAVGADLFVVNKEGVFTIAGDIADGKTAKELVMTTMGTGKIKLSSNVDLSHSGEDIHFAGSLDIESGATLTLGRVFDTEIDSTSSNTTEYDINISSLSSLNLNGGTLKMYYVAPHIKSMTVAQASTISIDDVWSAKQTAKADATRIDSLQLDANLSMASNWKSNVSIGNLTGDGNLTVSQTSPGDNDSTKLWVDGVNDYTGNISLTGKVALTLNIGENESLKATQLSKDSTSSVTLTGSGVFDLGNAQTTYDTSVKQQKVNHSGVFSIGDSSTWTGTVRIQNASHNNDQLGLNLNNLSNANSAVELINVNGWFTDTMAGKLILTEDEAKNAAWTISNGSSEKEGPSKIMSTFNGAVSGNGVMKYVWSVVQENKATYTGVKFNGDISDWEGAFVMDVNNSLTNFNFVLGTSASEVNVVIDKSENNKGKLHLKVERTNTTTFNNTVEVDTLTTSGGAVHFNEDVTVEETVTVGGTLHVEDGTFVARGTLNAAGKIVELSGDGSTDGKSTAKLRLEGAGNQVGTFDFGKSGHARGALELGAESDTTAGALYMNKDVSISMEKGAELTVDMSTAATETATATTKLTSMTAVGDSAGISIDNDSNASNTKGQFTHANATKYVLSGMDVAINYSNELTSKYRYNNSSVSNIGSAKLTLDNAANALTGLKAIGGDIDVLNKESMSLQELKVATSLTVGAYTGAGADSGKTGITVMDCVEFGASATLNANLIVATGTTVKLDGFGETAAMVDGSMTLHSGLTLGGSVLDALDALQNGDSLAIFKEVSAMMFADNTTEVAVMTLSESALTEVDASIYFTNLAAGNYLLVYNEVEQTVSIQATIPEPTTATLSLLALAALAARRRRASR